VDKLGHHYQVPSKNQNCSCIVGCPCTYEKTPPKYIKNPNFNSIPSSSLSASFSKSAWAQEPEDNVVRGKKKVTYHNNLWQRTK
jgi:hypothetical protein